MRRQTNRSWFLASSNPLSTTSDRGPEKQNLLIPYMPIDHVNHEARKPFECTGTLREATTVKIVDV
jgi:hypothetical protein